MPGKTGPKTKLTSADHVRIASLIEQGRTDVQIAALFGVSRTTILRLRHSLSSGDSAPVALNPLEEMIARNDTRRAILDQINQAYNRGEDTAALWARANAA